ncbi:MAG TPA: S53 family peptidase [Candidatus Acidoferrum sp.]|nr:S53 family peptidase [Candidatus Acidoferrum sp.]
MPSRTGRVQLKGSARQPFAGATKLGPADTAEKIQVTVILRRGSAPGEFPTDAELGRGLPAQRTYLTREEFAAKHGARSADIAAIRQFASENNLAVVSAEPARRTVILSGTVGAFSKAFSAQLHHHSIAGRTYRCRTGLLEIPAELENIIEGVFGLDNRPQARTHFRRRVRATATDVSFTALQVAQAYNFPAGTDGTGQAIALIELGGGYSASDLSAYFGKLGIAVPNVSAISVDGATNSPTGSADGPDGEVELDIEVAGAIAPAAKIGVYFAPNTDQGFIDAVTTAAQDTTLRPTLISISWGGPENSWTAQARNSLNSACQDAATMGVSVFVASGDSGATDGSSNGALEVDFPSSSPYVIGCGGTKLAINGSVISSEVAWNELSASEGATGGGVSEVFPLPSFQSGSKVPAAPNGFKGRGVPDVCGDADPASGYEVLVDGESTVIGGTSAVAPLWAGLVARINQSIGKPAGYLNPLIYSATADAGTSAAFHDITSGSNGGYSAAPGWDPCTGLGSPNGAALLAALRGSSVSSTPPS